MMLQSVSAGAGIPSRLALFFVLEFAFVLSFGHAQTNWLPPQPVLAPNASPQAVALEYFNPKYYMVFSGFDQKLYYATSLPPGDNWGSAAAIPFPASPPVPTLSQNVALRYFNETRTLYGVTLGENNEVLLFTFNGASWTYVGQILNTNTVTAISTPQLEVYNRRLYLVFRNSDNRIYSSNSADGVAWSSPTISAPPGFAVLNQVAVRTFGDKMYFCTMGEDYHMYMYSFDGTTYSTTPAPAGTTSLFFSASAPTLEVHANALYALWFDRNMQLAYSSNATPTQAAWTTSRVIFPGQLNSTQVLAAVDFGGSMTVAVLAQSWPTQIYVSIAL